MRNRSADGALRVQLKFPHESYRIIEHVTLNNDGSSLQESLKPRSGKVRIPNLTSLTSCQRKSSVIFDQSESPFARYRLSAHSFNNV